MKTKTYKLTRPFDDGTVVHPRGAVVALENPPKSAKAITAKELAAQKAALSDAEDAVKAAERAELKAELLAEIKAELSAGSDEPEDTDTDAEVEAANAAVSAAVTGGVDNDGKPLKDVTTGKPPVQKAGGK